MCDQVEFEDACHSFLTAAFDQLTTDHVIPPANFRRFLRLGQDYFGDQIGPLPEFQELVDALERAYPLRFTSPPRMEREHASQYIYSFLEACIARCALEGFDTHGAAAHQSITELRQILDTKDSDVAVVRYVSHLATVSTGELQIGDITVIPDPGRPGTGMRLVLERIQNEIPSAPGLFDAVVRGMWHPPHALLITRAKSSARDAYETQNRLSARIDRFLFLARLLTSGSVRSCFQISGPSTFVAGSGPHDRSYDAPPGAILTQRLVELRGDEKAAFSALDDLVDAAEVKRDGMFATSFDVALARFDNSHNGPWSSQLVDLATALEATLIGADQATEAITFKLQTRVAALLASDDDPADVLFRDVSRLYDLRSKLVHGGQIRFDKHNGKDGFRQIIKKVSTVPPDAAETRFGVAVDFAVDRLRDIVRRSILARLCLAESRPEPLWPFVGSTAVDALLTVDANRAEWRRVWRDRLDELGVGFAADKAEPVKDWF